MTHSPFANGACMRVRSPVLILLLGAMLGLLVHGPAPAQTTSVEAHAAEVQLNDGRTVPAEIVGYDHETGFGLLKAIAPLKVRPLPLGKSAELKARDPVLVASHGGPGMVAPVHVAAKREFAGSWEYLLDEAIFTSPPHPAWSGAALINREGKLVGVGSLIVRDAAGIREQNPGNMFVPIDRLPPILAELIADGRAAGPLRPWL